MDGRDRVAAVCETKEEAQAYIANQPSLK